MRSILVARPGSREALPHAESGSRAEGPQGSGPGVTRRPAPGAGWLALHGYGAVVAVLLVAGGLIRLPALTAPTIEQRETQSALLARSWAEGGDAGLPRWRRDVLAAVQDTVRPIEPPLLEGNATLSFRLTGSESLWAPRLLSILSWVLGGLALVLIASRVTSRGGALVALVLYLVWPYGVWHSRLFMPDALMVALLLAASLAVIRYWERPSSARLLLAGSVSSVASAVKPGVALLFLVALFLSLAAARKQLRAAILGGRLIVFGSLAVALAAVYVVAGTRVWHFISPSAATRRLTPDLLVTGGFWDGWWTVVSYLLRFPQPQPALALVPLAVGLLGIVLARPGVPRAILGGLSIGYVAFSLAFANYTSTHPYYSLALIPILSLAAGVVAGAVLQASARRAVVRVAVLATVACVAGAAVYKSTSVLAGAHPDRAIADYREIGRLTDHTTRALIVDRQLATAPMYWGWIVGRNWELDYNERLPSWLERSDFDYLIVVGSDQLWSSPGLRAFARGLPTIARTDRYAIFDLRPNGAGTRQAVRAERPERAVARRAGAPRA